MGTFSVTIEVGDPQGQRYEPVEALVDTGATYTVLPLVFLRNLGVEPIELRQFEIADDRVVEYPIGETWIRLGNKQFRSLVVFGESEHAVLGAFTLEAFGLAVDPVKKRLIRVPGLLM